MTSYTKMIGLARQLKDIVGPIEPSPSSSSISFPSHLPALHLPPPPDVRPALERLGVAPSLARVLATAYVETVAKATREISASYSQVGLSLQRVAREVGAAQSYGDSSAALDQQILDLKGIFASRYQLLLSSLETKLMDKVTARRQHFTQVQKRQQQYRHSTRKGFAKKSVEVLRKIYLVESYPNIAELRVIAEHIGMDYKQTRVWVSLVLFFLLFDRGEASALPPSRFELPFHALVKN
ncbi:hypothetical protein BDY24DRAFT_99798 [Mrakia frigida]|uniref:homeobox domain-containing protein n=1 Tax=Mrakia frigida TaxID=29902 RepID=UPI003FCBF5EF